MSYMLIDTRSNTNIALPLALSFLRDLRTAEYAYEAPHPTCDPFNQPPYHFGYPCASPPEASRTLGVMVQRYILFKYLQQLASISEHHAP